MAQKRSFSAAGPTREPLPVKLQGVVTLDINLTQPIKVRCSNPPGFASR